MKKLRLACAASLYPCKERPPIPKFLDPSREFESKKSPGYLSYVYWTKIYWATPPWLNDEQKQQMEDIYNTANEGEHVDHIVPLKNDLVCGLHVPWNLQVITDLENLTKSNKFWPDCPIMQLGLF